MVNNKVLGKKRSTLHGLSRPGFKVSALAFAIHLVACPAMAGPEGGSVKGGAGHISTSGNTTTIEQLSDRMAIDWQSYDVNVNERVQYIQPSSSSISLNRILSNSGSQIQGQIDANGIVILANPNGVFFGPGATVNVGGLVASGLNIEVDAFMNGDFALSALEGGEGKVINSGLINAATGGSVTLLGKQVENNGVVIANLGRVNLAAGKEAVVTFDGDGLVGVRVTQEILQNDIGVDAAVVNSGEITANEGQILLTASVSQDIFSQAVNSNGEAKSVVVHDDGSFTLGDGADVVNSGMLTTGDGSQVNAGGQVVLLGDNITHSGLVEAAAGDIELHAQDTLLLTGPAEVNAASPGNGVGGSVKLLGDRVGLLDSARVNASGLTGGGAIYIGGDYRGENAWLPTADRILISRDAVLQASALLNGDGGRIINWADSVNWFYGSAYAEGGVAGGNGGLVEISAPSLDYNGVISVFAPVGLSGRILFDPENVNFGSIDRDNTELEDEEILAGDSGSTFTLSASAFNGLSGAVTIEATNDITLNADFGLALPLNTQVTSLTFTADQDKSGAGSFTMGDSSYIRSSGVPIYISGYNITLTEVSTGWWTDANTTNSLLINRTSKLSVVADNNLTATSVLNADGWGVDTGVPGDSGGDVSLIAGGNISIAGVTATGSTAASAENAGGEGGTVFIQSSGGNVTIGTDGINTSGGNPYSSTGASGADAGDVYIGANSGEGTITLGGDIWVGGGRRWANNANNAAIINGKAGDVVINGNALISDTDFIIDSRYGLDWMDTNHPDVLTVPNAGSIIFTGTLDANNNDANVTLYGKHVSVGDNIGSQTSGSDSIGELRNFAIHASGNIGIGKGASGNPVVLTELIKIKSGVTVPGVNDFSINSPENSLATAGSVRAASFTVDNSNTFFDVGGKNGDGVNDSVTIDDALSFQSGDIVTSLGQDKAGGNVYIETLGTMAVGGINTQGGISSGSGEGTVGQNGGLITLSGSAVTVTGAINSSGSDGNDSDDSGYNDNWDGGFAGDVSITSSNGSIRVLSIVADGGNGDAQGGDSYDDAAGGNAGNITLNAQNGAGTVYLGGNLSLKGGRLFEDDEGAAITVDNGSIGVLTLKASDLVLTDNADIYLNLRDVPSGSASTEVTPNNFSFSGPVNSEAGETNDLIIYANDISFTGAVGQTQRLGDIELYGSNAVSFGTNPIKANSFFANAAGLFSSGNLITAGTEAGNGGDVTITSGATISIGDVHTTSGDGAHGSVSLISTASGAINAGLINTNGTSSAAGADVIINTSGSVSIGAIDASAAVGGVDGGSITIEGSAISLLDLSANGGSGTAGQITINATESGSNFSVEIAGDVASTGDTANTTTVVNLVSSSTGADVYLGRNSNNSVAIDSFFTSDIAINGSAHAGDTLYFADVTTTAGVSATQWTFVGGNTVVQAPGPGVLDTGVTINNVETLHAGAGEDIFIFTDTTAFTGAVYGNAGADTFRVASANMSATVYGGDDASTVDTVESLLATGVTTWTIGNSNGSITNSTGLNFTFNGMESLVGGSGAADTFTFLAGSIDNVDQITGNGAEDTLNVSLASAAENTLLIAVGGKTADDDQDLVVTGVGNIVGSSLEDTLVATGNVNNNWSILVDDEDTGTLINGTNDGTLAYDIDGTPQIVNYINFANITGGSGNDTFTFNDTATLQATVDGIISGGAGSGIDILNAANNDNTWIINSSADTLTVSGGNNSLNGIIFSGIETLNGGSAKDSYTFGFDNSSNAYGGTIDAGDGADDTINVTGNSGATLGASLNGVLHAEIIAGDGSGRFTVSPESGSNTNNVLWAITGKNKGSATQISGADTLQVQFEGFAAVAGGDNNDFFTVNASGELTGVSGAPTFDGAGGSSALTVNSSNDVNWTLLADGTVESGSTFDASVNYNNGTEHTYTLTRIKTLQGTGAGSHALTAKNQANYWVLASTAQSVSNGTDTDSDGLFDTKGGDEVFFTGMDTLYGNEDVDQFEVSDRLDIAVYGGEGAPTDNVSDVFTLLMNTASFWHISADETGSVNAGSTATTPAISFYEMEAINAPDNVADTFDMGFTSAPTMLINAGNSATEGVDDDTVSYSGAGDVTIGVSGAGATSGLLGIENIIGNGGSSRIYAINTELSDWSLSATENSVTIGGVQTKFSGFTEVTGGAGSDIFTVVGRGDVQSIDGGDNGSTSTNRILVSDPGAVFVVGSGGNSITNADASLAFVDAFLQINAFTGTDSQLDALTYGQAISIDLDSSSTTSSFALSGFISVIADSGFTNSFYAADTDNSWLISGVDTGSVAGVSFENFSTLTGGTSDDTFTLGALGSVTGQIGGGGDNDTTGDGDVIVGRDEETWWYITGTNTGFVNSLLTDGGEGDVVKRFVDITSLSGGTASDTFVVRSGTIAGAKGGGGTGQDTLSYAQAAGPVSVSLSSSGGFGSFSEIEKYIGNNTNSTLAIADSVNTADATATWNIDGENDGDVIFTGITDAIDFENFNIISGGNNTNDTFVLAGAGRVIGSLSGGTGGTDTITGPTAGSHFVVGASNYVQISKSDTTRRVQSFSDIETLTGGTGTDTFNIASSFSGNVHGGTGNGADELLVSSGSGTNVTWSITGENSGNVGSIVFTGMQTLIGGDGNDTFALETAGSIATLVDGGTGSNAITASNNTSRFVINATEHYVEQISDSSRLVGDFSNISKFNGGSGDDEFSIAHGEIASAEFSGGGGSNQLTITSGTDTDVSWVVDSAYGGSVASNTFSAMQVLVGGAGSDSFSITSTDAAVSITGGAEDTDDNGDTLSLDLSTPTTWDINGSSNTVGSVTFEQIETLEGSLTEDTFNVSVNAVDSINGRAGNDLFNIDDILVAVDFIGGSQTGGDGDILVLTHGDSAAWSIPDSSISDNTVVSGSGASQGVSTFDGIETVRGSDGGVDKFNISDNSVARYEGRGGDDIFSVLSSSVTSRLVGGSDTAGDKLTLDHSTDTSWDLTTGMHTAGSVRFEGIEIAEGSSGQDTFVVTSEDVKALYGRDGNDFFNIQNAAVSVSVFGGTQTTAAGDVLDLQHSTAATWTVDGSATQGVDTAGTILFSDIETANGSDGGNTFAISASELNFSNGGSVNDIFRLDTAGIALQIDGAGGSQNILQLTHGTNSTWTLNANPQLTHGALITFSNIDIARGGSGVDTFNISDDVVGTVEGYGESDVFNISTAGLQLSLLGGSSAQDAFTDSLILSYVDASTWTINGGAETVRRTDGGDSITFSGFASVIGGSGVDTFDISADTVGQIAGGGEADIFNVDSSLFSGVTLLGGAGVDIINEMAGNGSIWNLGTTHTLDGGAGAITFGSIETINGRDSSNGADTFTITASFTGNINGLNGNDTFNINAPVNGVINGGAGNDTFHIANRVSNGEEWSVIGDVGDDTFWLNDLSVVAKISGGTPMESAGDTIWGFNGPSNWSVFGNTSVSTVSSFTTGTTGFVEFSFIENLRGRNDVADTFLVNVVGDDANIDIEAGDGISIVDTIDYSEIADSSIIDLASDVLSGAERVKGNGTLVLRSSVAASWLVFDFDSTGTVADGTNDGTVVIGGETIEFVDFTKIRGSTGQDSFEFGSTGVLNGSINGNGGGDILTNSSNDTNWIITGANTAQIENVVSSIVNVSVLQGGSGSDKFSFNNGASWTDAGYAIAGGEGLGEDSIVSNSSNPSQWTVSSSGAGSVVGWLDNFSQMEVLNGSAAADTFTVRGYMHSILGGSSTQDKIIVDVTNPLVVWNIDTTDGGNIQLGSGATPLYLVESFSGIEFLTGGGRNDNFILTGAVSISGEIDGGAGENILDMSGMAGVSWLYLGDKSTYDDQNFEDSNQVGYVASSFSSGAVITGGESRTGLVGPGAATIWEITTDNDGIQTVKATWAGGEATHSQVGRIVGRNAFNDTFNFMATGFLNGGIGGGTGAGVDTLNAPNIATTVPWNITSDNTGNVTFNSIETSFAGIESINGGSGPDYFLVQGTDSSVADISIAINGGNGANIYTINTYLNNGITGGSGVDIFTIDAGIDGAVLGGEGNDQFIVTTSSANLNLFGGSSANDQDLLRIDYETTANWTLGGSSWRVVDGDLTPNTITLSQFEQLEGSDFVDTVSFEDSSFSGVFSGRDGADVFTLAADNLVFTLHGQSDASADDSVDTVINTHNTDATWVIADSGSHVIASGNQVNLTGVESIQGGGGRDTISTTVEMYRIKGGDNNDHITLSASVSNGVYGDDGADTFIIASDSLHAVIDGGTSVGDLDSLQGADSETTNKWVVSTAGKGSLTNAGAVSFYNMESLTGGIGRDEFDINAALTGTVSGRGGNDIFEIAAQVANGILGGSGDDQFIVEGNTFALALDGEGGESDTLNYSVANAVANQWQINAENEGSVSNGETVSFEDIEILQGSASADYFTISNNVTGEIRGGDGVNTYLFTHSGISATLVGGENADTIQVTHSDGGTWTNITGTQTIVDGSATPGTITFGNIETFIAGNGDDVFNIANATTRIETNGGDDRVTTSVNIINGVDLGDGDDTIQVTSAKLSFDIDGCTPDTSSPTGGDTFIGFDENAQWLVNGANSGTYTNNNTDFITFINIENLTGGEGNDTFTLNSGAVLNGVINGGGHSQQIANTNAPDFDNDIFGDEIIATALLGGNTFIQEATYSGSGHYSFANVERLSVTAQAGVGNYDTIQSGNAVNSWVINGSNQGILINGDTTATTYFTGFQNVQGGLGVDQFALQGNNSNYIDGQIHGGSGPAIDTIDYSLVDDAVTVQLGSLSGGIADVEGVTGYREGTVGANHQRILIGVDGSNDSEISVWTIRDFDGASVVADGINDGVFSRAGDTYQFTNFNTLVGRDNNDQFVITGAGRLTGGVIGDGGSNTLNATGISGHFSAQVSTASASDLSEINPTDGIVQMSGISTVSANGNFSNTFYAADNTANGWLISSPDSGTLNGISFNRFGNLIGGDAQDSFVFTTATTLSGLMDGNGGATDSVDATALNDGQIVLIGNDVPDGVVPNLKIANVETVTLNGNGNELVGDLANRTWAISGSDAGTITRTDAATPDTTIEFSGFGSLRGNNADDRFIIAGSHRLSGTIEGSLGQDSLDLSGVTAADNAVTVALINGSIADADFTVSDFERLIGSTNATNTLAASNIANNWQVTGADAGSLNETLAFTNFASLLGGNNVDTFTFLSVNGSEGALSGFLDGGAQPANTVDTVSMAALSAVDIQLGGENGMVNIEHYIGNNTNSRLRAHNVTNTWVIDAENGGELNGSLRFEQFNYLQGGSATDNFLVNSNGSVTGEIIAGEGVDTLTLTLAEASQGTLRFNGGAASDTISVVGGDAALVAEYSPETLIAGESELEYRNETANTEYQLIFSGAEQISDALTASRLIVNDTSETDTITLNASNVALDGFPSLNYSNKDSLEIDASANDTVTVANTVSLAQQLILRNVAVEASNNAQVNANTLVLDSVGPVGTSDNRLNIDAVNLMIQSVENAIYVQEANQLNIAELSSSDVVDIVANGSITDSAGLVMQGADSALLVQSVTGSVVLDNANAFSGSLTVRANDEAQINSAGRLSLAQLSAQNATLTADGNIVAFGPVMVERTLSLDAAGNLEMSNAANQLGSVIIVNADSANIVDSDRLAITEANVSGALSTQSQGLLVNGAVQAESLEFNSGNLATTLSGTLTSRGDTVISATGIDVLAAISGRDISLNAGTGNVDQQAQIRSNAGDIAILGNAIAQNAELLSESDISVTGVSGFEQNSTITAAGGVDIVVSGGSINMGSNTLTSATTLGYTAANNMTVARIDASSANLTAGGNMDINGAVSTTGDTEITAQSLAMGNNAELHTTGILNLTTTENADLGTIVAGETLMIAAGGELAVNKNVQGSTLLLSGDSGVMLDANLSGEQQVTVESTAGDINLRADVTSAGGDVNVSAGRNLEMSQLAKVSVTGDYLLTLSSGADLSVTTLSADTGGIVLSSGGEIVDQTVESSIAGDNLVISAASGVRGVAANNAFNSSVNNLQLTNYANSVAFTNDKTLNVMHMRNNGDILLEVLNGGDIVLDNTRDNTYVGGTDPLKAGGVSNANFDMGDLTLLALNGRIIATGNYSNTEPDIVGENATLLAKQYGTPARALVYYVKNNLTIDDEFYSGESFGSGYYRGIRPASINDFSNRRPGMFDNYSNGGEQLVEVEELVEIDPAIFTNVSNYFFDDVSIRLPNDQLYEDELEELAVINK